MAEFLPAATSSAAASTSTSGSIPLNSIGFRSLLHRLRVGMTNEATPEGNVHVRLELEDPAVFDPKSRAPAYLRKSRASVSPADAQPASITTATGRGNCLIRSISAAS